MSSSSGPVSLRGGHVQGRAPGSGLGRDEVGSLRSRSRPAPPRSKTGHSGSARGWPRSPSRPASPGSEWGFGGCRGLTQLALPTGLTHVGAWSFTGCTGMTQLTVPAGLAEIGCQASTGCSKIAAVLVTPDPAHPREPPPALVTIGLHQLVEGGGAQLRWAPDKLALGGDGDGDVRRGLELPPAAGLHRHVLARGPGDGEGSWDKVRGRHHRDLRRWLLRLQGADLDHAPTWHHPHRSGRLHVTADVWPQRRSPKNMQRIARRLTQHTAAAAPHRPLCRLSRRR